MRFVSGLCLVLLCVPAASQAQPTPGACAGAIAAVEREAGLPPQLLMAIGLVESGRRNPRGGGWAPWPWTIDAAGQSAFFDTQAEAEAAVRALQARGVQSIDVGCMQVNLLQHPTAFASLDAAFDPLSNVRYAARFLGALYARSKAWPDAAALYHSATPALGEGYRRRVMAAWPAGTATLAVTNTPSPPSPQALLARAWAATLSGDAAAWPSVRNSLRVETHVAQSRPSASGECGGRVCMARNNLWASRDSSPDLP